jgi:hypothetical protein
MTRAPGRYEREIANGPALSLHLRGRSNTSISLLAALMNLRSAFSVAALLSRRTVSQVLKIE